MCAFTQKHKNCGQQNFANRIQKEVGCHPGQQGKNPGFNLEDWGVQYCVYLFSLIAICKSRYFVMKIWVQLLIKKHASRKLLNIEF